jgi:predicted SnoaL-like aldol condensation-catalyzing enzyme
MRRLKDRAIEFLQLASAGDARRAFELHAGPAFCHHNPWFAADAESLMQGMIDNAAKLPAKQLEVLRAVQEADLVVVHSRMRPAPEARSVALVHIFRFEQERIAELWDVAQPEPETTQNALGMF